MRFLAGRPGWLTLSLALFLFASVGYAQERSGEILGTVVDDTGAPVPGALIQLESKTQPKALQTISDAQGRFHFFNVPIGEYTVTTSLSGFSAHKATLDVRLGSQLTHNPKLAVGAMTEVVEVTGAVLSIDPTSSRSATNITTEQIDNLAKSGRGFNSLLALAPGVFLEPKNGNAGVGGVQVGGSSGAENAFYIDGAEVSDLRRGSLRESNNIPLEFVQEIQVKSGGFEAEFGGATGGVVNVATRSGANEFHGSLGAAFTGDALNGRDRGFFQRSPLNADASDFFQPKEDDYSILSPSFTIGGPILKDRLNFFTAYSPDLEKTTRVIDYPSGSRTFKQNNTRHFSVARLDFAASPRLQLNASYLWSPSKREGSLPNRDVRVAAPSNDQFIQGGFVPAQTATAGLNWTPNSKFVVSARYGYKFQNDKDGNYGIPSSPYITYATASSAAGLPRDRSGRHGLRHRFQHPADRRRRHQPPQRLLRRDLRPAVSHLQGRLCAEPRGERRVHGLPERAVRDELGRRLLTSLVPARQRNLRLLHLGRRRAQFRGRDQPQPVPLSPGHVAARTAADPQPGRARRKRVPAALQVGGQRHQGGQPRLLRLGRQDRSPRRLRLGPEGRRPVEGERELRLLLRHAQ